MFSIIHESGRNGEKRKPNNKNEGEAWEQGESVSKRSKDLVNDLTLAWIHGCNFLLSVLVREEFFVVIGLF